MQTLIGSRIGDYDIEVEIGRGAMGVVYRARQVSLSRLVALKVLSPLLASDASYVERFKREATIAATLDHPSIVRVYEAGTHLDLDSGERLHYFAMQYIEGETVNDRLQRERQIPLDETVAIAVHIAQALDYAWRKTRLIHRDIKPSNIFLSANGEVKLGDLGLARSAGDSQGGAGLTATGNVVGTAYFMSPEQARGERGLDFRSDIYGLGCMFYRMLCGRHLYEGPFASVLAQHLTEPPPNLRMVLPDCPVELSSVIEKMLAKHPSGRQQSYEELIEDLRRAHEQITNPRSRRREEADSIAPQSQPPPHVGGYKKPAVLYTAMTTTTIIALAGVLVWAPWKQSEQQPLNREDAKARSAPVVAQTRLSAATASPQEQPKPASDAPSENVGGTSASRPAATQSQPTADRGTEAAPTFQQPPTIETPALPAKPVIQLAQAAPPAAPTTPAAQPSAPKPADEAFIKSVSAMPPEQQVQAVIAKLKELNPTFDGKETHKIENGAVTTLSFSTVGVTDISPVKALRWLRTLSIAPPTLNQKGSLESLAPLQGMQLTWLWCHNNPITDLSPLKGMPLTTLSFGGTQVSDISPLTGMKLQVLSFNDTVVSELAPLEGMPLTVLWCNNTKVADLTPLKAMPLREIKCDFVAERDAAVLRSIRSLAKINDLPAATFWARVGPVVAAATPAANVTGTLAARTTTAMPPQGRGTAITPAVTTPSGGTVSAKEQIRRFVVKMKDLNPEFDGEVKHEMEGGKIVQLEFRPTHVTNISPVADFTSIKRLLCSMLAPDGRQRLGEGVLVDIGPLKGLRLDELDLCNNKVRDLSPLAGMKLRKLTCTENEIVDLSPLRGMPLVSLSVGYNKELADISPLEGMKLEKLMIHRTQVRDLTPLRGMPLTMLHCGATRVSDFSVLKGMRLFFLDCSGAGFSDSSVLKGMPLTEIRCDFDPQRDTKVLRSIKTLNTINRLPALEFWKRVEAGEVPQVAR